MNLLFKILNFIFLFMFTNFIVNTKYLDIYYLKIKYFILNINNKH